MKGGFSQMELAALQDVRAMIRKSEELLKTKRIFDGDRFAVFFTANGAAPLDMTKVPEEMTSDMISKLVWSLPALCYAVVTYRRAAIVTKNDEVAARLFFMNGGKVEQWPGFGEYVFVVFQGKMDCRKMWARVRRRDDEFVGMLSMADFVDSRIVIPGGKLYELPVGLGGLGA